MPGGPMATGGGIGSHAAPKSKFSGILMTAFAAFGGILFGYDTGSINGIKDMKDWLRTMGKPSTDLVHHPTGYAITTSQTSLVVSILSAGTFFGALLGAPVGDIIGRKFGIVAACGVFAIGIALQTAAVSLPVFVVGRVFAGLGVGLVSCLIPMYQSECAPKWIRGAVIGCYQFAITIGIFLASVIIQATHNRDNHSAYRIPVAIQFVWAGVLALGMCFLPESPRFLIKKGNDAAAAKSLGRLLSLPANDPAVELELDDIRANLEEEKRLGESSYLDCFRPSHNKIALRTLTGIFIQAFQQLTGINFIFYYGTSFFQNAGITNAFTISIATSVVNMGMTIPGIYGIEKFGRRRLLLVGAVGMCVCEYIIAIVGVTTPKTNHASQQSLIAFVCIYIGFFAATWGPIAWAITGEIFPLQVRAKAMSMAVASNWLWNFAIGYATPYLVDVAPGSAGLEVKVFFIWGTTCFFCIVFTYFCVPETKGLSLEQIDIMYQNTTPVKSLAYRRQLISEDVHASDVQGKEHVEGSDHHVADEKV